MVERVFKIYKSDGASTGYEIVDQESNKTLDLPEVCKNNLKGKYIDSDTLIEKISTAKIALAGVTDSLNIVDEYSLRYRSVIKSIGLKSNDTIDDTISDYIVYDGDPESIVKIYESYHTIYMDRDIAGNDKSIHAYINTPKDGRLRCVFDKSIRINAKRNNIKYWVEDYKIESGSAGGKFVRPIGTPIEIP